MIKTAPVNKLTSAAVWIAGLIIMVVPFHAFLTVWLSSGVGHYTLLRLWKEFLLVPVTAGALYTLFKQPLLRKNFLSSTLVKLIFLYFVVMIACAVGGVLSHGVSAKAMWYGLLVDLRFLVFFLGVAVLTAGYGGLRTSWRKLLITPAILVAALAILQFLVLPYDFLKHFGYGDSTIAPYETIDHNLAHLRVMSALRGANPLGAYLVLPICAAGALLVNERRQRGNKIIIGAGLLLALVFSFSRSAWLGAAAGLAVVIWLSLKNHRARRNIAMVAIVLAAAAVLGAAGLRHNAEFQNVFLHTQQGSASLVSSNYGHRAALDAAAKDIVHHPLGSGVGSAGPQSVYNDKPARIAEDYYLQIGQETGWIGMILFMAIIIALGRYLYARRADPLALALLAALVGLCLVNLLSHAWEDDTLAYVFWGLAGISFSPVIIGLRKQNGPKNQNQA